MSAAPFKYGEPVGILRNVRRSLPAAVRRQASAPRRVPALEYRSDHRAGGSSVDELEGAVSARGRFD